MRIHTSSFRTIAPGSVSIARITPSGLVVPRISILAPGSELLASYKRGGISWETYSGIYWSEFARCCRAVPAVWLPAHAMMEAGEAYDRRQACLLVVLTAAARKLGTDELTLLCYEKPSDPHCHRKLVFDALPQSVQGTRG